MEGHGFVGFGYGQAFVWSGAKEFEGFSFGGGSKGEVAEVMRLAPSGHSGVEDVVGAEGLVVLFALNHEHFFEFTGGGAGL